MVGWAGSATDLEGIVAAIADVVVIRRPAGTAVVATEATAAVVVVAPAVTVVVASWLATEKWAQLAYCQK